MGLRTSLDWYGKSRPTGIRSPDRPARRQSLYRLRYPAHRYINLLYYKQRSLLHASASYCGHLQGGVICRVLLGSLKQFNLQILNGKF